MKNMKTDTGGLYGTWNDDPTDDLTMQYSNHTVTEDLSRFALSCKWKFLLVLIDIIVYTYFHLGPSTLSWAHGYLVFLCC